MATNISRRAAVSGMTGIAGLMLLGWSGQGSAKVPAATKVTMYRSAGCGCCLKWAEAARAAGYQVAVVNAPDIMAVKAKLGVPTELTACHTSIASGYVLEGHVPFDAVNRLLRDRPAVRGIGVPGMPVGAPGMEVPSGAVQPFQVMAFDVAGKVSTFS